jgi:predicted metal-dependent hydrolase
MYTDGSAPTPHPWEPDTPWEEDRDYLRGLDLFDQRYYWESHEVWEGLWNQVPKESSFFLLLQALIQAGAYAIKVHSERHRAAERLLKRIRLRLAEVASREGSRYCGLELAIVLQRLEAFAAGGAWPSLHH